MAELILTTPGAGTWIVPAGVTSIQVECWGGGGSGGYHVSGCASGGGSAAWARTSALAVTPGQTVHYHVGAGGAARSGSSQTGAPGEDTWLNKSSNAAPASTADGCLARRGLQGNQGATVAGGAGFINGTHVGDAFFNGRNANGAVGAPSATGGSGSATPLSLGNISSGTAGETAGGPAGTGGGAGGPIAGDGVSDVDGGGGGGGSITTGTEGGDGGAPGGGGGGGVGPTTTRSGAGGRGQIRITYTAAPTAGARRVVLVMM